MSLQERQNELARRIREVRDEQVIDMLEEELSYFLHRQGKDVTDILSDEELQELKTVANEPSEQDSMNENEFKTLLRKWRTGS